MNSDINGVTLLTVDQVAALLVVSRATVYRLRNKGQLPSPVQFGTSVRWRRQELVSWIAAGCPSVEIWETMTVTE